MEISPLQLGVFHKPTTNSGANLHGFATNAMPKIT